VGQLLLFLGVAIVGVVLIHYYIWRRLVRNTSRTTRWRRAGTWTLVGLSVLLVLTLIGSRVLPHSVAAAVSWPGYLWLAVMFYLVIALAVLELPALAVRVLWRRQAARTPSLVAASVAHAGAAPTAGTPSADSLSADSLSADSGGENGGGGGDDTPAEPEPVDVHSRRLFIARAVAITAGLVSVGVVASGVRSAMGPPQLKRIQIPLAKLPRTADGYRIALVSDIHLGPLRGYSHTRRIVDIINGLDADIVTVVGDLVDGTVAELGTAASPLRDLRSRNGSFFVTGNHEYYSGYQEWVDEVARLGVRPLRNEWLELPGGFDLSGVNDVSGESFEDAPDFDKALAGRDPSRAVVMLAHQPIQAFDAAKHGVDLQLSGHTHGGQLAPFNVVVRLAQQPVVSGLGHVDGMPVYVTNGAGFWGPPVRVGAPPDITLVELRST
jgi:predicted MPP superfamily phosphohydrolase